MSFFSGLCGVRCSMNSFVLQGNLIERPQQLLYSFKPQGDQFTLAVCVVLKSQNHEQSCITFSISVVGLQPCCTVPPPHNCIVSRSRRWLANTCTTLFSTFLSPSLRRKGWVHTSNTLHFHPSNVNGTISINQCHFPFSSNISKHFTQK